MRRHDIIVLHGALGARTQMQPIADALGALGYVHVIDWPGHGDTPLEDRQPFTLHGFADYLGTHIARLELLQPVAFGHSMGGYVALALESQSPGTFGGIVTLGTKFDWNADNAEREAARLDAVSLMAKVPKFAETLENRHRGCGGWKQLLDRTASLLRHNVQQPLLDAESLARVRASVSVAVGSRDDTVTVEETKRFASMMPCATHVEVADISHPIERVPVNVVVDLVKSVI